MGIAVRRIARATLLGAGALATTLAAEVMAARRHRFVPSHPRWRSAAPSTRRTASHLRWSSSATSSVAGVGADATEDTLTYGVAKALSDQYEVTLRPRRPRLSAGPRRRPAAAELKDLDADIVLVCVGTNDVTHGTHHPRARRQLRLLVQGLAKEAAPDAKVIVSGLPPARPRPPSTGHCATLIGFRALLFTRLYRAELAPASRCSTSPS